MMRLDLGILLWSQGTDWASFEDAARRVDELGYDHLWTWDHLYAIFGDPHQDIFEGWMAVAAWAQATTRIRLGLMVTANTFRSPGLTAKLATTLDHISGGRAMLGLGAAWHELEHRAFGLDFGDSPGQRLAWLEEAAGVVRGLLDGREMTHHGERYQFDRLQLLPRPVQRRLPIMIGGSGERKTLRTVARHADMWNAFGDVETLTHKARVLESHCEAVGRDPADIVFTFGCKAIIRDREPDARRVWEAQMEYNRTPFSDVADDPSFWVGTPEQVIDRAGRLFDAGFRGMVSEMAAPYDQETLERLVTEVRPHVG